MAYTVLTTEETLLRLGYQPLTIEFGFCLEQTEMKSFQLFYSAGQIQTFKEVRSIVESQYLELSVHWVTFYSIRLTKAVTATLGKIKKIGSVRLLPTFYGFVRGLAKVKRPSVAALEYISSLVAASVDTNERSHFEKRDRNISSRSQLLIETPSPRVRSGCGMGALLTYMNVDDGAFQNSCEEPFEARQRLTRELIGVVDASLFQLQDLLAEKIKSKRHLLETYFPEFANYQLPADATYDASDDPARWVGSSEGQRCNVTTARIDALSEKRSNEAAIGMQTRFRIDSLQSGSVPCTRLKKFQSKWVLPHNFRLTYRHVLFG
uniref:Uncharacterized protein n=1 Tax=Parascaris equorum TaxID=6256 RepID=A0A914RQQ4_PAREQ